MSVKEERKREKARLLKLKTSTLASMVCRLKADKRRLEVKLHKSEKINAGTEALIFRVNALIDSSDLWYSDRKKGFVTRDEYMDFVEPEKRNDHA